jgi:glucose-1-phosphate cytidylyltransferase
MDVVIFCGGFGSRLSEDTFLKPKPMVEIDEMPIIMHLMNYYACYGHKRFILLLGYKSSYVKKYFHDLSFTSNDLIIDFKQNSTTKIQNKKLKLDWEVILLDTGLNSEKGSRLSQARSLINSDNFFVTYGDGLSDVNLFDLEKFHTRMNTIATLTAVRPPSRFGEIDIIDDAVLNFTEKPQMDNGYINGGFFVFKHDVFNYLTNDPKCDLEIGVLQELAFNKNLSAYKHNGFWQCMDNIRDKAYLQNLLINNKAPWKIW